jgi:hypothetical protein
MVRIIVVNDDYYREINRECARNPFHGNLV